MRIDASRHKGLSKEDFHRARQVYRALRRDGWTAPVPRRRRTPWVRLAWRARRTPERAEWHQDRALAYAREPVCLAVKRARTDGKGRGRSGWQGRLGTSIR